MENFRLYKREKLCSHTAINQMFSSGKSVIAYPLRAVYRIGEAQARGSVALYDHHSEEENPHGSGACAFAPSHP